MDDAEERAGKIGGGDGGVSDVRESGGERGTALDAASDAIVRQARREAMNISRRLAAEARRRRGKAANAANGEGD